MEVQFKMRELGKRSRFFQSARNKSKRLDSVTSILKGVGLSTLPCRKLQAIVDAASEIHRLFSEDNDLQNLDSLHAGVYMGADDFLPIFIYSVVKAEIERPCALCVLLRTLCDPSNRTGRTGYYLASFEAAVAHLQETDVQTWEDISIPFVSIALDS